MPSIERSRTTPWPGLALFAAMVLAPAAARAADEEIQVYMDEMSPKGGFGLDVHVNYVLSGRGTNADYAGQMASEGRWRITPEVSYGLTPHLELGAYLPLATIDDQGHGEVGGVKGRLKYIGSRPAEAFFWGANFELGRVRRDLDINPWNAELKGIAGYRSGPWTVAANANIGWVVSGPDHGPTTLELATKISYRAREDLALGLESYNDLGSARHFGRLGSGDQRLYFVADKSFGGWDLDLGIGRGFGRPEDRWVIKAIIGVPID